MVDSSSKMRVIDPQLLKMYWYKSPAINKEGRVGLCAINFFTLNKQAYILPLQEHYQLPPGVWGATIGRDDAIVRKIPTMYKQANLA